MVFLTALSKVLPIFLLILLGVALRRWRFLGPETVKDLRKVVVNITLPAVLFLAFSQVTLAPQYLVVVAIMFTACLLALLLGRWLTGPLRVDSAYLPSLLTGFEAGMMGYAIYAAVYGAETIYKFGIVDLGQVLFVFFVLVPGLERLTHGARPLSATALSFLKTPVILAILGGLLFKATGLTELFTASPLLNSTLETLGLLGALTTPLVALVIGYGLTLRAGALARPVRTVAVRLLLWLPFGLALSVFVVGRLLGLDQEFQAAVLTMVLLPPPFVIPMFMAKATEEDANYVVNTLTLATLVTLFAYALVPTIFPPGL
ncbi:MAG: AEC family transporter [Anaerolineae bacterium]